MDQCYQVTKEDQSSCGWQRLAVYKEPKTLRRNSQSKVAEMLSALPLEDPHKCINDLRNICHQCNTSLPVTIRTSLIREFVSSQDITEPQHVVSIILLHLLTDVTSFTLKASVENGDFIHLEQEHCDFLLQELEGKQNFQLETFRMEGVNMEEGVLTHIIQGSSRLHSIHVSGDISKELLSCLEEHPRSLHSLQIDNATVTDREVIGALLGSKHDLETLGSLICEGGDIKETITVPHQEICQLSVESPFVTVCGGMVLLHYLPKLQNIRYSRSVYDILLFHERLCPVESAFNLYKIELGNPSDSTLVSLRKFCPHLKALLIECHDPCLQSFEELSKFPQLKSLTLRLISEELICSAVKEIGRNLHDLKIEFGTTTSISLDTIKSIQENCVNLQRLELQHVRVEMKPGDHLSSLKKSSLSMLKHLRISNSFIHPAILERLIVGNSSLETLFLDVSQESLTDQVLETVIKHNSLEKITSVYLGAGLLSAKGITSLLVLKKIKKVSFDLQQFPSIAEDSFNLLEKELLKGNYRCVLENSILQYT